VVAVGELDHRRRLERRAPLDLHAQFGEHLAGDADERTFAETQRLDAATCGVAQYGIDAYEALLLDVIDGDHSLFLRFDEVSWAWRVVDPILKVWATERDFIHSYPAGSWGPQEANRLFDREDQYWRNTLEDE